MKVWLVFTILIIGDFLWAQGGLEAIIVEEYPVNAEASANDANLPANAIAYRVFVDMLSDYELQAVFSLNGHALIFNTSEAFYNNQDFGSTSGQDILNALLGLYPAVAFDSYITLNAATNSKLGILMTEDTTDGTGDGLVDGTALPLQTVGEDFSVPFGNELFSHKFSTNSGIYNVIGGEQGPTEENRVLIGQFTTDGEFSFELNIQIRPKGSSLYEQYVARDPQGDEIHFPGLVWPPNIGPDVTLTAPQHGSRINTGTAVVISATASDPQGVAVVNFLVNNALLSADSTAPYQANWSATEGMATIAAVAIDSMGVADTSNFVVVEVTTFAAPSVSIASPAPAATVPLNAPVQITADATDTDGNITMVTFFVNNVEIGTDGTSPYQISWTPSVQGNALIKAVVADNDQLTDTSEAVLINVVPITTLNDLKSGMEITIFPNPATDKVFIGSDAMRANPLYELSVSDTHGKLLIRKTFIANDGQITLDISALPKGIYCIRLNDPEGNSHDGKLVKQ